MSDVQVIQIVIGMLEVATKVAAPILIASLVIGVVVSMLQTITQIQEMTLTFVPKLIGAGLIMVFGGSWILRELVTWVSALWRSIPDLI